MCMLDLKESNCESGNRFFFKLFTMHNIKKLLKVENHFSKVPPFQNFSGLEKFQKTPL